MLTALGVFNGLLPPYVAAVFIELYSSENSKQVQIHVCFSLFLFQVGCLYMYIHIYPVVPGLNVNPTLYHSNYLYMQTALLLLAN